MPTATSNSINITDSTLTSGAMLTCQPETTYNNVTIGETVTYNATARIGQRNYK